MRNPTGILVHRFHVPKVVLDDALAYLRESNPEMGKNYNRVEPGWTPLGYVKIGDDIWIINNEGVGEVEPATEDQPHAIELFGHAGGSHSIFPVVGINLTPELVLPLPVDEVVDLADHIRSFGSRLDANVRVWANHFHALLETVNHG